MYITYYMSYSQIGQDLEVLNFYNKKDGFFIEIGASDGIFLSNTYLLEKDHNWKGICVEPVPSKFELLCKNRPNSFCCDKAVFNKTNENVMFNIWKIFIRELLVILIATLTLYKIIIQKLL